MRRRVDATHQLHKTAERLVRDTEQRLVERLTNQSNALSERVSSLQDRVTRLELAHQQEAARQKTALHERGMELRKQMDELQQELVSEKKSRLVREGRFLQQLESHGQALEERWTEESNRRSAEIAQLTDSLNTQEAERSQSQSAWQIRVSRELKTLQDEMAQEIHDRQQEDEAIVKALQLYTSQLQQSLAFLNDDDVDVAVDGAIREYNK